MSRLVVDVVFRGKVLETLAFDRPVLRIGRLADNDVVIDNLGVSRFHARLHRGENAILLEDAGSENGCLVNGERVAQRRAVAPGDRIEIGKHEIVLRRADDADVASPPRPSRRKEDAWDGGRTYVLGMPGGPRPGPEPPLAEPELQQEPVVMSATPKFQNALPEPIRLDPVSDGSPELDFGFDGSLAEEIDASASAISAPPAPVPMHAGFIVQVQGKLERVAAWHGDTLVAGRSSECDIVLGQDEVSRRHARFERDGDVYQVTDLGSVNGTFVNGRRVERGHSLQVGDIVQIEGFTLTFVLDRQPIDGVMAPQSVGPQPESDQYAMTMLQEELQPIDEDDEPVAEASPLIAESPAPIFAASEPLPEADLLGDDVELLAAEEELEAKPEAAIELVPRGSSRAASVQDLGAVSNPNLDRDREVCFELRVRVDLLPPALRKAFEEAGASEIVLPAELRLKG
jgi:pSer/pThr/pTyr-binding forkhead associated (FHA) protein